jgi:hypothetical protein
MHLIFLNPGIQINIVNLFGHWIFYSQVISFSDMSRDRNLLYYEAVQLCHFLLGPYLEASQEIQHTDVVALVGQNLYGG